MRFMALLSDIILKYVSVVFENNITNFYDFQNIILIFPCWYKKENEHIFAKQNSKGADYNFVTQLHTNVSNVADAVNLLYVDQASSL